VRRVAPVAVSRRFTGKQRAGLNPGDFRMTQNDNKDFECRQCGAHFDSRDDLDRHNRSQHSAQAGSSNLGSSSNQNSSNIDGGSSSSDRNSSNR